MSNPTVGRLTTKDEPSSNEHKSRSLFPEFESNEEKDRNIAQVWSAQGQVFINALNPFREQGNVRLTQNIGTLLHLFTTEGRLDNHQTEEVL